MPVLYLALGFVLLTIGLAAAALSLAFWKRHNPALLTFGVFAFIYGVNLLMRSTVLHPLLGLDSRHAETIIWVVNYWLCVPALMYTEETRGPGRRGLIRRLWQLWLVLASAFTLYDIATGRHVPVGIYLPLLLATLAVVLVHVIRGPAKTGDERRIRALGSSIFVSSIIVDNLAGVFWPGIPVTFEPIGVASFIGSLGFVTARQFFASERELAVVEHEMNTARDIQTSLLPRGGISLPHLRIAARYLPMRGIAGDIYDFHVVDDHRIGVLVADVIGHGVPAALVASMVKVAFTSQRAEAARPAMVLAGMNDALCDNLAAQFVTAAYIFIDSEAGELRYSLAGHPPPILFRQATGERFDLVDGAGVFLGFDPAATYQERRVALEPGDRLLIYTDGLIEAQNAAGGFFGDARLREMFTPGAHLPAERFAGLLLDDLRAWSGHLSDGAAFEDDLTIVVVDVGAVGASLEPTPTVDREISGFKDFRN